MIHRYRLVAAHAGTKVPVVSDGSGGDITFLLYVCEKCSKPKVRTIDGIWSVEELGRAED